MHRRDAVAALLGGVVSSLVSERPPGPDFGSIERQVAGRLGVSVLDTATGRRLAYREDECFAMCSTFKWLLGAQILSRADAGTEQLSRVVPYGEADLLEYAPITRAHVREGGMTISGLVAAAIQYSDNTAANLLLQTVGGPAAFTAYLRLLGDRVTRLDRIEPDLNSAIPGDSRDTTTPNAMVTNLRVVLLGNHLSRAARARLIAWLVGDATGAEKLRAGLPAAWRVGDKTGMGAHGATNDVAVTWPAGRGPVLIAAYLADTEASVARRNDVLAKVGHAVGRWVQSP